MAEIVSILVVGAGLVSAIYLIGTTLGRAMHLQDCSEAGPEPPERHVPHAPSFPRRVK